LIQAKIGSVPKKSDWLTRPYQAAAKSLIKAAGGDRL